MKSNKVILLTGASSGIGYDTAVALAQQGHKVYAAARRVDRMEPLRQYGIVPLKMDVTDEASMQEGVKTLLNAEGRIDVLINNAGYGYFGAVENVPMDDARNQLEVNVFGLARLCQLVLPTMRAQHSGRIINTASVAGRSVFYYGGWYHVSKYAVESLSDAMRMELKPFGIDVVIIEPGAIKTNWGIISADHLIESSKGTAYEQTGTMMANNLRNMYLSNTISDPAVVRKAIVRAVNARRPCTRYRIGRMANAIVFFHWLLPTRWWDAFLRLMGKRKLM
ncbi:MAG: SDR family NAD(P)-dependent oxidoreductase [Paludibacteraceae bacterium]|nr:SDR family NAD(P)-dependent oxidoreductase [Paludibacteraceae bacterium]MBQ6984202.1 SDR family NAD(P)-dependent oxidoreductase [Paludibacteraceae bacterium]